MVFEIFMSLMAAVVGFGIGYLMRPQPKAREVKSLAPHSTVLSPRTKLQPFTRKEKRSPRVNDDEAGWRKENDV